MSALPPIDLRSLDGVPARTELGMLAGELLAPEQREELALSDLFARVRDEIALSRARCPDLLQPGTDAVTAANELTLALRFARPGDDRAEIIQRAAALMALAARVVLDGTPVFPGSLPHGGAGR